MADLPGLLDASNSFGGVPGSPIYVSPRRGSMLAASFGSTPSVPAFGYGVTSNTTPGRSPVVKNLLNQTYASAVGLAQNPTTKVTATTKSPDLASRVGGLYTDYDKTKATQDQSISDYVNELLASKQKNRTAMDAEQASIGRVYGTGAGSLSGDLAAASKQRQLAVRAAAAAASRAARRENNLARMAGGNNSYLDRAYAQQLAQINAQEAATGAATNRDDILAVQGQRNALLGQGQASSDRFLNSLALPADTLARLRGAQASNLGQIGALESGNTQYDYMTPEQQIAMRLGLIDQVSGIEDRLRPQYGEPGYVAPTGTTGSYFDPMYADVEPPEDTRIIADTLQPAFLQDQMEQFQPGILDDMASAPRFDYQAYQPYADSAYYDLFPQQQVMWG